MSADNWTPAPEDPGPGYRWLEEGESIQVGDEAWTWVDDCTASGWLRIENVYPDQKVDENHVRVRRAVGFTLAPEHYVNELRETVSRVRELFTGCRDACPPQDADPEAIAKWEGAFLALRGVLVEELNPLLDAWEKGSPLWRSTEVMLEGGDPETVIRRVENAPTD